MSIATKQEYTLTESKLASVRKTMAKIESDQGAPAPTQAASLRSLRAYTNQLIEELVRYETAHGIEPLTIHRLHDPVRP